MERMNKFLVHIVLASALLLSSCGYISDKPVQNGDLYRSDELQQKCKIDVTKLGEIFKADQKEQIKCLQENFIQFTKYVRSQKPGSVTENELGIFIKRFFEGQSDSIIKGLSIIFQLNMILLKDEADRISNNNISPLFELLVQVNQEAVIITDILREMDREENQGRFWDLRAKFIQSVNRFSSGAIGVIEKSPGLPTKLNIRDFILDASKKIGESNTIDEETIDSFIFLKRILLAGDTKIITSDELKTLIAKLPKLMGLVFDVYYANNSNFKSDTAHLKFYLEAVRDLYEIIQFNQPDFQLFTTEQLVVIAEKLYKEKNVRKFKSTLEIYKQKFIGGNRDNVTLRDLRNAVDLGQDLLERLFFNNVTYDYARLQLADTKVIKEFPRPVIPEYEIFSQRRGAELHQSFADIVINFRYFRNKDVGTVYYGTAIKRNTYGFQELAISKWLSQKLIAGYGHKDAQGVWQVSMDEFKKFLDDSKPLLEEFKLWSPNPETFSRNSVLLADLFQDQSNGDLNIGINECTEYISMILSAVDVSGKLNDTLSLSCNPGIDKEEPKFETGCYNNNFFDTLLNKLKYSKQLPRLAMYINEIPKEEAQDFLNGVEGFARDVHKPGVPVNRRDSTLILGAMLNIESTFIRFDSNSDNLIDYKELREAFKVYKNSIITLAKLGPESEKYALSIFLYMVSKMQIPPTGKWQDDLKFAAWDACVTTDWCRDSIMDTIVAKRKNIGKLLYYLVNQNTTAAPVKPVKK